MKTEQIKAMLETGFTKPQIKLYLGVSDEEIANATEEKPKEEPKEEPKEAPKEAPKQSSTSIKVTPEVFKQIKEDMATGMRNAEIMKKYDIGNALFYRVKKSDTYEDLRKLRSEMSSHYSKKYPRKKSESTKAANYYTEELWKEGKAMREQGLTYREIAARQGYSVNFIAKALLPDTYKKFEEVRAEDSKRRKVNFEETKKQVFKEKLADAATSEKVKSSAKELDSKLVELRSMADSLARIAEALEKIAEQPKKRGLFRK